MSRTVEQRVTTIIAEQFGKPSGVIEPEQDIFEDLGADSLDVVEIVMEAEAEFDIDITDEEAEKIRTVQDAIDLVTRRTA